MIDIQDLQVKYGDEKALDKINLNIPKNTTCAIIGPSGCGKTTLLYTLAGLKKNFKGRINIEEKELKGIRQKTGVILQDYGLLPWKTVKNNVSLGLRVRNISKDIINKSVDNILDELGIYDFRDKYPSSLSGGQKQRVAIARTLITNPDLLLLDEATSALDAMTKEHLQNLILKIYKKKPITLVFVTHSIEEAVFLGQRIVIMDKGKVKHIMENPYFGMESIRSKMEYYNKCLEVRKFLKAGEGIE